MTSSGQCSACGRLLPPYGGRGRPQSLCGDCKKERQRLRMLPHDRATRTKRRAFMLAAKDQPCADCGVKYPPCVMEFDHVRGEKSFSIASRAPHVSIARLAAEIAKCDVRCSNCHRLRHWRENATPATD